MRKRKRGGGDRYSKRFKTADSRLRYLSGQQKYFAKSYKATPYDDPVRQVGRAMIGTDYKSADKAQKMIRRALNYYGPGDYKKYLRALIPDGSFSQVGRYLGGLTGIPGMNAVGSYAGNKLAKYVGFGDYGTVENQLIGGVNKGQISVNDDSHTGDVYITQTEFIQNISCSATGAGASAFQIVSFPLNPGLSVTFPFLSQLAQNYTMYEFEGLMFKFNPTSGENNATSNSLGKVIMATNYDPSATAFVNSVQMENYDYANAAKPSQTIIHGVETKNSQQFGNMQYVRTGSTTRDKIFTDIGTLYVATEGVPFAAAGTQVLGELWVTYRVKLSRANLFGSLIGQNIAQDFFRGTSSPTQLVSGVTLTKSTNTLGCTITNTNSLSGLITFPANISLGTYLVIVNFASGSTKFTTQQPANFTNPTNCLIGVVGTGVPAAIATGGAQAPFNPAGTTSNDGITSIIWVTVQAPGALQATLNYSVTGALTATTTWSIWITQVNQIPTLSIT